MEIYYGGTEIQLGIIRLPVDGVSKAVTHQQAAADQKKQVKELIQTNNQARFYGIPVEHVEYSDKFRMFNGGLVYSDMGHPEYATPELHNLEDVVYYEVAGRRAVDHLLRLKSLNRPTHGVFANNTDYFSNTFAYHENYKVPDNPNSLVPYLWPFLITRQIFSGAGQVLPIPDKYAESGWFSLAQRSLHANTKGRERGPDVYVGSYSVFAKSNRHNDYLFHFTGGDATTMKTTTELKIGSTAMVLKMLQNGWRPPLSILITDKELAVKNLKTIALDQDFNWRYESDEFMMKALDVQRIYFDEALKMFHKQNDPDAQKVLTDWGIALDALESDPLQATWLDWPNKFKVLSALRAKGWSIAELLRVDLAFHAADPQKSIYQLSGNYGTDEAKIARAMYHPPSNTRALGRSIAIRAIDKCVDKNPNFLKKHPAFIDWRHVSLGSDSRAPSLQMEDVTRTYQTEAEEFARIIQARHFSES